MTMEAFTSSLSQLVDPLILLTLVVAVLIGAVVGVLPGVGAIVSMALLLPFVAGMDPFQAFALLLGMYAITSITGDLTAILVGVPGTPTSAPLILDGYQLTKQGWPKRAMGAAVIASGAGALAGAVLLGLTIPVLRPIVLSFASPEVFMLAILGLTMVGGLSGKSVLKGVAAGFLGLLLSTVGPEATTAVYRFTFGQRYLLDGFSIVPLAVGLFAIPELMSLHRYRTPIAHTARQRQEEKGHAAEAEGDSILSGAIEVWRRRWMTLRCSLLGAIIGAIPGLGGDVAAWAAYGHAQQTSKESGKFGQGSIDGVIGPAASNNSKEGGGLVPTIAFGVPGTATMAVLLGAFVMVGLTPGPGMVSRDLDVTLFMVWVLVVANLMGVGLSLLAIRPLARIAFVPGTLLVPFVLVFVVIGAATATGQMGDLYSLLAFGLLSLAMQRAGWPIVPFVLGFVLGPQTENNFWLSLRLYGVEAFTRPLVLTLAVLVVVAIWLARRQLRDTPSTDDAAVPRGGAVGTVMAAAITTLFGWAAWMSLSWRPGARAFPLFVAGVGFGLTLIILVRELYLLRAAPPGRETVQQPDSGGPADVGAAADVDEPSPRTLVRRDVAMIGALVGLIAAIYVVGIPAAMGAFTLLYLWRVHGYSLVKSSVVGFLLGAGVHLLLEVLLSGVVRVPAGILLS
jgi:putative tricarboxylic transport membrane protein